MATTSTRLLTDHDQVRLSDSRERYTTARHRERAALRALDRVRRARRSLRPSAAPDLIAETEERYEQARREVELAREERVAAQREHYALQRSLVVKR